MSDTAGSPRVTGGRLNLIGSIDSVTILNSSRKISFKDGKTIKNYPGFRLFCNYTSSGGTLAIVLADGNSGIKPSTAPQPKATSATFELHYRGSTVVIPDPVTVDYQGGLLAVGVTIDASSKWDTATLTINIEEKDLATDDKHVEVPGYVISDATAAGKGFQLRWVDNPVILDKANDGSQAVPPLPSADAPPPASGAGVSGPMGIETP